MYSIHSKPAPQLALRSGVLSFIPMRNMLFIIILFLSCRLSAQRYNYQWIFGYDNYAENSFGLSMLDFNDGEVTCEYYGGINDVNISFAGSFINSSSGSLQLFTDNCELFDNNFNIVEGSKTLNPGYVNDNYCDHPQYATDYPSGQAAVLLPEINNDSIVFLLHKNLIIDFDVEEYYSSTLYLSTIIQKTDGSFELVNKEFLLEWRFITRRLTACRHANGDY